MPEETKDTTAAGNAQGGRNLPDPSGALAGLPKVGGLQGLGGIGGNSNDTADDNTEDTATGTKKKAPEGFGIDNGKDVKGSLKVHIKLDLEADIRIIARVKGDIAIGLL